VKKAGGKLALCKIRPDIKDVFVITKLDKIIKIVDDEQTAIQSVS
jgi:anti-anti-sigma regulatory factor